MKNLVTLTALMMFFLSGNFVVAQDDAKKTDEEKPDPTIEMNIEITLTIMNKMFEKAGLDAEQTKSVESILSKYTREIVLMRRDEQSFMDKKQREKFGKALKMAQKAKLTGPEAQDYALRKLGLPPEKVAEFKKLKASIQAKSDKMNAELGALLTEEQRNKVPLFKKMAQGSDAKAGDANAKKPDAAEKAEGK